jgi:hypothetical protein
MAAGDFTASQLCDLTLKIDQIYADPRNNRELEPNVDATKAILENQRATFHELMLDGKRCVGVKAAFLKSCDTTVDDCTTPPEDCEISGVELESASIDLETDCLQTNLSVLDDQCADVFSADDKVAFGIAQRIALIEENLNNAIIAWLIANATANVYSDGCGTIDGETGVTCFDAATWAKGCNTCCDDTTGGCNIWAELDLIARFNEIKNPVILSGTPLFNQAFCSPHLNKNDNGKATQSILDQWNLYFDPRGVDTVAGEPTAFMIEPWNVAFWAKSGKDTEAMTPVNLLDQYNTHVWQRPSTRLFYRDGSTIKPVMFDIRYQRRSSVSTNTGDCRLGHHFNIKLNYGLGLGPNDCADGSGILQFGVCPAS